VSPRDAAGRAAMGRRGARRGKGGLRRGQRVPGSSKRRRRKSPTWARQEKRASRDKEGRWACTASRPRLGTGGPLAIVGVVVNSAKVDSKADIDERLHRDGLRKDWRNAIPIGIRPSHSAHATRCGSRARSRIGRVTHRERSKP